MRKYTCILVAGLIFSKITTAQVGQIYKPFKIDVGLGRAGQPFDANGFLLYAEPSFTFADRYKPGLRFEYAILSMKDIGSSALTFDYYFLTHIVFVYSPGVAIVFIQLRLMVAVIRDLPYAEIVRSTRKSGGLARIGFDWHHFHLSMEYNFVPSTYVTAIGNDVQNSPTVVYKNNYFALKLGVSIGGGKKRN